jgi:hypothetical protein
MSAASNIRLIYAGKFLVIVACRQLEKFEKASVQRLLKRGVKLSNVKTYSQHIWIITKWSNIFRKQ